MFMLGTTTAHFAGTSFFHFPGTIIFPSCSPPSVPFYAPPMDSVPNCGPNHFAGLGAIFGGPFKLLLCIYIIPLLATQPITFINTTSIIIRNKCLDIDSVLFSAVVAILMLFSLPPIANYLATAASGCGAVAALGSSCGSWS